MDNGKLVAMETDDTATDQIEDIVVDADIYSVDGSDYDHDEVMFDAIDPTSMVSKLTIRTTIEFKIEKIPRIRRKHFT